MVEKDPKNIVEEKKVTEEVKKENSNNISKSKHEVDKKAETVKT